MGTVRVPVTTAPNKSMHQTALRAAADAASNDSPLSRPSCIHAPQRQPNPQCNTLALIYRGNSAHAKIPAALSPISDSPLPPIRDR